LKTYCKPADCNIEDIDFIRPFVHRAFHGKLKKRKFQNVLIKTGKITRAEILAEAEAHEYHKVTAAIDAVTEWAEDCIRRRDVHFDPVRQFEVCENGKRRTICEESAEQQIFEYICEGALQPLFRAKILHCQYGSIPSKGQVAGKRKIERIMRRKLRGALDVVQGDVKKAYPSTQVSIVLALLRRDIGKNKPLLWLVGAVMANYPGGALLIGGFLPCWLFNYVMSYILRNLLTHGQKRRGKWRAFVRDMVCYADDFAVFGRVSALKKAMLKSKAWSERVLGLTFHGAWKLARLASFSQERRRRRCPGVDMMGYVVRKTYTIIRGRDYVRVRRQFLRAGRELDALGYVPWWRGQKLASYWGMVKYTDSAGFQKSYDTLKIFNAARKSVSWHYKKEAA